MKKLNSIFSVLSIFLLLISCSKKEDSDYPDEARKAIEYVTTTQERLYSKLTELLQEMDTATAKDSVASLFMNEPDVEWAEPSITGISVQYKSGIKGGLFFGSRKKGFYETSFYNLVSNKDIISQSYLKNSSSDIYHVPPTKRTVIICPIHDDFPYQVDTLVDQHDRSLKRTEFEEPEFEYGSNATVEKFSFLANYGIIFLYSHGVAWPSEKNIQEVYFLTGEKVNDFTNNRYWGSHINKGKIPMLHGYDGDFYFIGPEFIKEYNYLDKDSTLIYGGFCFSGLGTWPDRLMEAGARGYFGFDWSVYSNVCDEFQCQLVDALTDTLKSKPVTCGAFMNSLGSNRTYYDSDDNRNVSLNYYGDDDLALWLPKQGSSSIDFTYKKVSWTISAIASCFSTVRGDFDSAVYLHEEMSGTYKSNVFTGTYSFVAGVVNTHDSVIVSLDLANNQVKGFKFYGSYRCLGDYCDESSNYLVISTDKTIPLTTTAYSMTANINDGTTLDQYLKTVQAQQTITDNSDNTTTTQIKSLKYNADSYFMLTFSPGY